MNIIKSHPHNKTSPQRMLWPDVIRIIAIYLVVQIHTSYTPPSWQWLVTILFKFGVMGVPLFVILSGALLLGKQEDYKTFFRKRCMRVLLPWIVWTFLYMIYFFKVNHHQTIANFFTAHTSPFSQWLHFFLVTFLTELWFLPMIFSLYLITPLLRIITIYANDSDNFYLIVLWFLLVSVMPFLVDGPLFPVWEPNVLLAPLQYSGYFLLGYIVTKQKVFKNISLPILLLISVSPFLFSLLPLKEKYIQQFASGFLFPGTVIASIFFFYFLFAASNKLDSYVSPLVRRVTVMVSGASLGVYIIHGMLLYFFSKAEIIKALQAYHAETLLTIITFSISTIIILLLQRIPVIKYIVPK